MRVKRLPLVCILLAALSAPALAQQLVRPGSRGDDYYLRNPDRAAPYPADRSATEQPVDLSGTIVSVDRDRESVRLRTRTGLRTVELYDGTRLLLKSGRQASLSDVRAGDAVQVSGEEREGRIVAERVTLLDSPQVRYAAYRDERAVADPGYGILVGTVRTPTYDVSRKIKVRTSEGDVTVTVDPHTPITKDLDYVSVHELERGDRVRVTGEWDGTDRMRARRIEVLPDLPPVREETRGYRSSLPYSPMPVVTVTGRLVSFDHNRDRMRLSTPDGDRIVIAKGTPAYVHGMRIDRGDMRQGDRVRATGYWDGTQILATRVELAY